MRIGFTLPQFGPQAQQAGKLTRFARRAEELGVDSLWVGDRLLAPVNPTIGYAVSDTIPDLPSAPAGHRRNTSRRCADERARLAPGRVPGHRGRVLHHQPRRTPRPVLDHPRHLRRPQARPAPPAAHLPSWLHLRSQAPHRRPRRPAFAIGIADAAAVQYRPPGPLGWSSCRPPSDTWRRTSPWALPP